MDRILAATVRPGLHWHFPHLGGRGVTVLVVLLVLAALAVHLWHVVEKMYGHRHPFMTPGARAKLRMWPGPGFADRWELWRRYGKPQARAVARRSRPSLPWWRMYAGRFQEYARFEGWAQGWLHPWRVYSTFNDLCLGIAPPQSRKGGKSARAAGRIIDAPGPVVATTIRSDLIRLTARVRAAMGQLHLFDPEGASGYGSAFPWDVVAGCEDITTAVRRAGHMTEAVENKGLSDADFWRDQAAMTLASYLHAAALAGADIRTVHRWIMRPGREPLEVLAQHRGAYAAASDYIGMFADLHSRTKSSVEVTISRVMKFMFHPRIVEMLTPGPGEGFDFTAFLRSKDTLYLVAADSDTSPTPPLFAAFLAELMYHARQAGRLDPPLTLVLDEVANIARVPVWQWASWAAGTGVLIDCYAQSWAQLVDRWGQHGANSLWSACTTKVIWTGTSEDELLRKVMEVCGKVRMRETDEYFDGKKRRRRHRREWHDVLPPGVLRTLPDGRAVVIGRSGKPAVVRTERAWKRADVRYANRRAWPIPLPVLPPAIPAPRAAADAAPVVDELAGRRLRRQQAGKETGLPAAADEPALQPGRPAVPRPPSTPAPWHRPRREDR